MKFSSQKPLDAGFYGCIKNQYRSWLNRQIYDAGLPDRLTKISKIAEISKNMRPAVGQFCWRVSLFPETITSETPEEVNASATEREEENYQKCLHGVDQMFIDDEILVGDTDVCEIEVLDDDEECVELVEIPQERPEKPKIQKRIDDYFSHQ